VSEADASSRPLPSLSAAVLAGGAARRLGGEKADARVGGASLLERALAVARAVSDDVLLAGGARGLSAPGARPVPDWPEADGPLAGVGAALEAARHPWLLLLPCDQPWARADVAAALLARAREAGARGAVVSDGERLQPFPAVLARDTAADLRAWLDGGGRALTAWLHEVVRPVVVPLSELADPARDGAFLLDVATPDDLERARRRAAPSGPNAPCGTAR